MVQREGAKEKIERGEGEVQLRPLSIIKFNARKCQMYNWMEGI